MKTLDLLQALPEAIHGLCAGERTARAAAPRHG